ncbi:MAG: BCD family MFS transporter [Pseudomonadota bacterium]|jgi:BCD family chlorophyll transporter-like MFS transporter
MSRRSNIAMRWMRLGPHLLPFADAASAELPLARLFRLALFQVSVGMVLTLMVGTLNRVMIVELDVPALLVGAMIALPLVTAPLRALIGFRSDHYRSALGWRRVPFIWFGTLMQFGGLAIMPFALIVLSGDTHGPAWYGHVFAALGFLLVGAGMHTTQTVGLALATDLAPDAARPKVVALMCTLLLAGAAASSLAYGALLADFSQMRLIQVIQGTAVLCMALNIAALWRQEPRGPARHAVPPPRFADAWRGLRGEPGAIRRLVALALGTVAFGMQDILLEPYGGEVLGLSVSGTTLLTAVFAICGIAGFVAAARAMDRRRDAWRIASAGTLFGLAGMTAVVFAAPLHSAGLFVGGAALVGFGGGLFAHATLTAAMRFAPAGEVGLALGIWGAVQATAAGGATALSGLLRDGFDGLAAAGLLGETLATPATGYGVVYNLEIVLLFATLAALGPLVRRSAPLEPDLSVGPVPPGRSFNPLSREVVA